MSYLGAEPSGAPESNAGDDFHVLWAVSRLLRMLDPQDRLSLIVVEGVSPVDAQGSTPANLLLGVDLTEYRGGENIADADEVIVSQLKHSERNPTTPWTVARLVAPGSRGQSGVLRRLADAFRHFAGRVDREELLEKLTIQLVGNQPAHDRLTALIDGVHGNLQSTRSRARMARLAAGLSPSQVVELERLKDATGLGLYDFGDFLRVFSVGTLNSPLRWQHENQITQTLSRHLVRGVTSGVSALYDLVRRQALPNADRLVLRPETVLAQLDVPRASALFPFPPKLALPATRVSTPDAARIAQAVLANRPHIAAHGDAGVGKTTTLASLGDHLPSDSVLVLYDCFGGGEYLDPTESRHLTQPALLQIINELAIRCGTPLLLAGGGDELALWQHLRRVLLEASDALRPAGAHVVLAIDAADNASIAGERRNQPTFIPKLWSVNLPDRVHVIMTCRTHRRQLIEIPEGTAEIELCGFDSEASAAHLRTRFPAAADHDCDVFHARSGGNPRSQFYVLNADGPDRVASAAEAADAVHGTPREIFEDLLLAATRESVSPQSARRQLADLISLSRPVRLETFAAVSGISIDSADLFCHGLVPGAIIEPGGVAFRDEDFEAFLHDRVSAEEKLAANQRLADHFMALRLDDAEAATACAEHLQRAGRSQDLIELAVGEGQPESVQDPVARLRVYVRRLELAMQVAAQPQWRSSALQLTLLAATASATSQAVSAIVRKRPDLAMKHGDPAEVAAIYEEAHSDPWRGALHMRVALIRAIGADREGTVEELRLADAWIQRWQSLPSNERRHLQLEAADVAAAAAAVYLTFGTAEAFREVCRWRPISFRLEVAEALVETLANTPASGQLSGDLVELPIPEWVKARLFAKLFEHGERVAPDLVRRVAENTLLSLPRLKRRRGPWTASFLELLAAGLGDTDLVRRWGKEFVPTTPTHAPNRWQGPADWGPKVRHQALLSVVDGRSLDLESMQPRQMVDAEGDDYRALQRKDSERRALVEVLDPPLETFRARAAAFLGDAETSATALESVRDRISGLATGFRRRHDEPDGTAHWAVLAVDALAAAPSDGAADLSALESAIWERDPERAMDLVVRLSRRLVRYPSHREAALRWLDRAALATVDSAEPATDRADRLLAITAIVDRVEPVLAAGYYQAAVEAAEGLDDEGAGVLRVHAHIAMSSRGTDNASAGQMADRVARAVERYRPYVSDDRYLPWHETVRAVTALHPPSGLALMARWEQENVLLLDESVRLVVVEAARAKLLDPLDALALLGLTSEAAYPLPQALQLLDLLNDVNRGADVAVGLEWVSAIVRLDLAAARRVESSRVVVAWAASAGRASLTSVRELERIVLYADSLPQPADQAEGGSTISRSMDRAEKVRSIIDGAAGDGVATLSSRLDELRAEWASEADVEKFLLRLADSQGPAQRRPFLEAIADLPATHWTWRSNGNVVLRVLSKILEGWRLTPGVEDWSRDELAELVRSRFVNFVAYEQRADETLPLVLTLPGVTDPGALIIEGLAPILGTLDSGQLFAVARALATSLSEDERIAALDWSLRRADESDTRDPLLPTSADETAVELLMAMFGHPDSEVRWRAAHAARVIASAKSGWVESIADRLGRRSCGPYGPADREHLWMSADLWALMVIGRAVADRPSEFPHLLDRLVSISEDRQYPHVARREVARRAALRLAVHIPGDAGAAACSALRSANTPTPAEGPRRDRPHTGRFEDRDDERFHFDRMDSRPYWFEPLGRLFALTAPEIERRIEHWIVDKLYLTNELVRADPSWHSDRYDYSETQNDHGALPRVEELRTYLEFHGMLLVAGELVDQGALVEPNRYDEPFDPWADWLGHYVDSAESNWIAGFRTPAPRRPDAFGVVPSRDAWRDRSESDYEAELIDPETQDLVVESYIDVQTLDRSANVSVSTALVSPTSASSLLAALHCCPDPWNFRLPDETSGRWRNEFEIDEPGFQLLGWVLETDRERAGLEEHDPRRRIQPTLVRPGLRFAEALGLHSEKEGRILVDGSGRVIARTERWADVAARGQQSGATTTSGHRTLVRVDDVLRFLATVDMDLICEVRIARNFDSRGWRNDEESEEKYETGRSRIYLLRRDGELATWPEVVVLGEQIVAQMGLEASTDTLGRWMSHRVAQLISEGDCDERARSEATDLVLRLWERRETWPDGWPPAAMERALRWLSPRRWATDEPEASSFGARLASIDQILRQEFSAWMTLAVLEEAESDDEEDVSDVLLGQLPEGERDLIELLASYSGEAAQEFADVLGPEASSVQRAEVTRERLAELAERRMELFDEALQDLRSTDDTTHAD